jgi:Fe2+ transport system protein FeoA
MGFWTTIFPSGSVCEPEPKSRILNYDRNGRIFLLPPVGRRTGARQVNILSELHVGESAVLVALDLPDSVQNHLMHMGFVPDAFVTALRRAPAGDPTVYLVDGMEIALRRETASAIRVRSSDDAESGIHDSSLLVEASQ